MLIYPWQQHIDQSCNKQFYYNQFTEESVWELPETIKQKVTLFYESIRQKEEEKNACNMEEFVEDLDKK